MQKVAFLGLGVMGVGMSARLVDAGFPVTVWNRTAERAEPLRRRSAAVAATPRDAAAAADVVIVMVADDQASRAVWTGDDGVLAAITAGALLIECSTVSPRWITELAELAMAKGCSLVDAPVTGSRTHAAAGDLVFLVGGEPAAVERAQTVLKPMSRDAVYVGPSGSGARLKLVNNFVAAVQAAAAAEALAFIEASGLDREAAIGVLANGAPGSPLFKVVTARMTARDYTVNFNLSLMRKDITYAIEEAQHHGVPLTTALNARALFDKAIDAGLGPSDFAAIAEVVPGRSTHSVAKAAGRT